MRTRLSLLLLIAAVATTLAACGFKLRGSDHHLPEGWRALAVEVTGKASRKSGLAEALYLQLQQMPGTTVHLEAVTGLPKIILLSERLRNSVSALDSLGRAKEYLLEYVVYFKFVDADGKEILSKQRLYLREEQSYSSSAILAKERESRRLQQQLHRRAATQIIERLMATINN